MLNLKISQFKNKYTTEVELVAVEEVKLVEEALLVLLAVEGMVDDEMNVDIETDGDVVIDGDVKDTKNVDIEVDNEVTILEVDDDGIYVVDDDEKVEDVLVVDTVFVGIIVEEVGTF